VVSVIGAQTELLSSPTRVNVLLNKQILDLAGDEFGHLLCAIRIYVLIDLIHDIIAEDGQIGCKSRVLEYLLRCRDLVEEAQRLR